MTGHLRRIGTQTDILGECPLWDADAGLLWWIDIRRPAIRRFTPATDRIETWDMPAMVGAIALGDPGCLVVALGRDVVHWHGGTDRFDLLARLPQPVPGHRFNDGRTDPQGRFWVGTMHNETRAPEGTLYRLAAEGLVPVKHNICIPNSLAWNRDGTRMYFADSLQHRIEVYDFDPASGTMGPSRRFAECVPPAFPDGAVTDAEGHLWVAEFNAGRVVRHAPDGAISAVIETPVDRPTACALGGPDLRVLYITTTSQNMSEAQRAAAPLAGALLACDVDVPGLPEPRVRLPVATDQRRPPC